jgi:hypothetical protein
MDPRERIVDLTMLLRMANDRSRADTWTALPVQVHEDSDGFICHVQPTIQSKVIDKDGKKTDDTLPTLSHVPVQFSAGGGFTITHPVKSGDEGLVVFSSRCIDNWWSKGGVQKQARERWHSLSDGIYIPGIRSKPRRLGGNPDDPQGRSNGTKPASTNSVQIRTDSGEFYIELTSDTVNVFCKDCNITANEAVTINCKTMTVHASEKITLDTPVVEMTGDLKVQGNVTAQGEVTGRNVHLSTHTHMNGGGQGNSGPPNPG